MQRKEIRKHIFLMLFRVEFNEDSEMSEQVSFYLEESNLEENRERLYITDKYLAIVEKKEEIDQLINQHTTGWTTERMSKVDLTILRLAVYEMKWDNDIPVKVAINEAVELSKKFGGEESPKFVNGVLAKLAD